MDISIVVPTHNNSERLKRALEHIVKLNIPQGVEWEMVVVNNRCSDDTDEMIKEFQSKLDLKYVKEDKLNVSAARNKGLEAASGKLLLFIDDDVKVSENWLAVYWEEYLKQPEGCFFGGPIDSEFETEDVDKELLEYAPFSVIGLDWGSENRELKDNEMFIGPNFAFPSYFIEKVGPYSIYHGLNAANARVGTGSETELMMRFRKAGLKPYYIAKALVTQTVSKKNCSKPHIMKRKLSYGYEVARLQEVEIKGPFLFGVPRWIFKDYTINLFKYIKERILGRKGHGVYAKLKYLQGYYYGCLDRKELGNK